MSEETESQGMRSSQGRFYVYHLIDPRSGAPFYVGKGQRDRIFHHECEARSGSQHPKCALIREIWSVGLEVGRVKVAHFCDEQAAYDFEAAEVERIGPDRLTNLISGGGAPKSPRRRRPVPAVDFSMEYAAGLLKQMAVIWRRRTKFGNAAMFGPIVDKAMSRIAPKLIREIESKFGREFVSSTLLASGVELVTA